MPTPPLDMLTEAGATANGYLPAQAGGWDGGLPRHNLLGYSSGSFTLDTNNRLDFAKAEEAKILFERAQKVNDPKQRIDYYEEIIEKYPEDEHVCEAQFMIGFVYAEELNNFDEARTALQSVINMETGCSDELKSSARWMLENMGKEPPDFETD